MTGTPSQRDFSAAQLKTSSTHSGTVGVIPVVAALALLIGGGIAHGTLTGRWQTTPDSRSIPDSQFSTLPLQFGEWDGQDIALDDTERVAAGATSHLQRVYTNRATGESVTVTLLCGPAGPIAVHLPTACYRGAGYVQRGMTSTVSIQETATELDVTTDETLARPGTEYAAQHQFSVADFDMPSRPDVPPPQIYWGWSTDGLWKTPENPRLEFSGQPRLFKLYVTTTRPLSAVSGRGFIDEFLTLLLPELRRLLSSDTPSDHNRAAALST